ncbi:hypothetical protein P296_09065 [Salmonella enterica subsp. arizonae serovar 18:z4,z23:- str. CVM N26624]|nr:hypothetical protein N898_14540 [Salmonella enterica subsp. arizonae serovar 62:z36:- str. RKS2983]KSB73834.1 hypothetical protein LFZ49_11335 [Salmonella enterica subsp. arizonae serovar 62:z36:- str. 5335/86]KSB79947.1 hypothetical protein LFZ51_01745 [Salmonella enterica subsp. arizonae serovar 63:g,z51:- str. So 20/20]KTW89673.1 hypothetical protein DD48_17715 [Salmonella enterica subsp. arizonae serovar 18:z4,z23:-]KTY98610.1 hypothetical protein DD91_00930 [Salmonella enterica subsp. a
MALVKINFLLMKMLPTMHKPLEVCATSQAGYLHGRLFSYVRFQNRDIMTAGPFIFESIIW